MQAYSISGQRARLRANLIGAAEELGIAKAVGREVDPKRTRKAR